MMKNLKGSTWEKQAKDISHTLHAVSTKKCGDNLSHSMKVSKDRDNIVRDFIRYADTHHLDRSEKLNNLMNEENMKNFLKERTENLSYKSTQTYVASVSSMLQGLEQKNIRININNDTFNTLNDYSKTLREDKIHEKEFGNRGVDNINEIISSLEEKNPFYAIITQVSYETGFRINEAFKLCENPHRYLHETYPAVQNMQGKGGRIYEMKEISDNLRYKLINHDYEVISKQAYSQALKDYDITHHDIRYEYAYQRFNEYQNDYSYNQALEKVSSDLNHSRIEITQYYLKRHK